MRGFSGEASNNSAQGSPLRPLSSVRWTICALIFFATTVNYLDRQLFSNLTHYFENELRLGPTDLALINVSFILPYGIAMMFVGRLIDRIGTRSGLAIAFVLWSVAAIGHSLVRGLWGFIGFRFLLGLGECAMFPSGVKAMTDWFPRKERALATGWFNAGSNVGAMLAPIMAVKLADAYGWRTCFLVTGALGICWIYFWLKNFWQPSDHPKVSASELEYINSDSEPPTERLSFSQLFAIKPLYALLAAKALSDAPWWLYLTWMPKFLIDQFHVTTQFMMYAVPVIYIIADVGSVAGGWLSSTLIKSGRSVGDSRKLAMLVCAVCVLPVMSVGFLVDSGPLLGIAPVYWAIGIVSLAAGAHQGWSCNMFTLISDTVPKSSISMAVGVINGFGMVGVSAYQLFVGRSVQLTSTYKLPFIVAGTLYLVALAIIQLVMPRVEPARTDRRANMGYVFLGAMACLAGLGYLQFLNNKPPFTSLQNYFTVRQEQLHAVSPPFQSSSAKVGWMTADWYRWILPDRKEKFELIKFDTRGYPFIEPKGAKAPGYLGPSETILKSFRQIDK